MKFAISPEKLRKLADWFDVKYPDDPNPEVQNDLRKLADQLDKMYDLRLNYVLDEDDYWSSFDHGPSVGEST